MIPSNNTSISSEFNYSECTIAVVYSSYHIDITEKLKNGALEVLKMHGVQKIHLLEVPGAFELVYGSLKAINSIFCVDGIVTLGCVIKGDTDHDIYINHAVAQGIVSLQENHQIPIGFGLLTTNNHQQALDRAGGIHGNKGKEVAEAVLKCISMTL